MDRPVARLFLLYAVVLIMGMAASVNADVWVDPVTRYFHISYEVPGDAPEEVQVVCSWSPAGKGEWRRAKVMPLVSETGLRLTTSDVWSQWLQGGITERRAAGLTRTVIFNPYPDAQQDGRVDADFRIEVGGKAQTFHLRADNSDVVYITDWSKVLQRDAIAKEMVDGKWLMVDGGIRGKAGTALPQLTYPLDLKGQYAVFVSGGTMGIRLTGDERTDYVSSARPSQEVLWRWSALDRQHLVLKQRHTYEGYAEAGIDYMKLVPLTPGLVKQLEAPSTGKRDKFVAAYFEPYSWAFNEDVQSTLQHREPLTAYKEAGVDLVDTQIGRFGMKVVYESRENDQLIYSTIGDPINGKVPHTDNVGRMQQYTNTLDAELRYCRELGLACHANFGATNCYPESPLQGDFSKQHPNWMTGSCLRYDVPEVREYILSLYREALEIGAPGISIDFCRYPDGVDKAETVTGFMRSLRKLADEHGKHVPILVRFPATGVRKWECFDYKTWAREGLVDYLCPSNIQGRHHHFDIAPYVQAVRGTKCKLAPVVDGISWGPMMPGPYLQRVKQLYDAGVDGIYIYQGDDRIVYKPGDRQYVRLLGSSEAVNRWWAEDARLRPTCSKGIYITPPMQGGAYNEWERLRVWLEGIPFGEVQMFLDGKLISRYDGPPYVLGTEEYESDDVISPGEHTLLIRARDGASWLEQRFAIKGNG